MITDLIVSALVAVAQFLIGLLPDVSLPGWMVDISGYASSVFGFASSMGVWFPWSVLMTVVGAVFASVVVGFGIKVTRMVISLMTAGGGSAA